MREATEARKSYKDLGWMNDWDLMSVPKEYVRCRARGHRTREVRHYWAGSHIEVLCDACRIMWRYDSVG